MSVCLYVSISITMCVLMCIECCKHEDYVCVDYIHDYEYLCLCSGCYEKHHKCRAVIIS